MGTKVAVVDELGRRKIIQKTNTAVIQIEIPERLLIQAQNLVTAGWYRNLDELILDAMRHFLDSHHSELREAFIHQDVNWGLTGDE